VTTTARPCPVDETEVERCARAAWDAGRCSPPWDSAAWQPRQTYLRSTRAVLATYLEGRTVIDDGRLARLVEGKGEQ
jgi:ribosomal protein L37AE/L43A